MGVAETIYGIICSVTRPICRIIAVIFLQDHPTKFTAYDRNGEPLDDKMILAAGPRSMETLGRMKRTLAWQ